jgi:hypothetical protein
MHNTPRTQYTPHALRSTEYTPANTQYSRTEYSVISNRRVVHFAQVSARPNLFRIHVLFAPYHVSSPSVDILHNIELPLCYPALSIIARLCSPEPWESNERLPTLSHHIRPRRLPQSTAFRIPIPVPMRHNLSTPPPIPHISPDGALQNPTSPPATSTNPRTPQLTATTSTSTHARGNGFAIIAPTKKPSIRIPSRDSTPRNNAMNSPQSNKTTTHPSPPHPHHLAPVSRAQNRPHPPPAPERT